MVNDLLSTPNAHVVVIKDQQLINPPGGAWQPLPLEPWLKRLDPESLMETGLDYQGVPCFLGELADAPPTDWELTSLRQHLGAIDDGQFLLASRALQLNLWRRQHRFCGQCGAPMRLHPQETAFHCQSCEADFYPRISPCIIVLISRGEYCLLAQHRHHRLDFYSTLAGYVETGESLEQTLHREVMEEVGLKVGQLRYFSSQTWPFPSQLMVGFTAIAETEEITIDGDEILDARWFHYSDLPAVPPVYTISGQLIDHFVKSHDS